MYGRDMMKKLDINAQQRFAEEMACYIFSRTSGSHIEDEIIRTRPSNRFFLGNLAAPSEKAEYDDDNGKKASIRAQRMEVSFLIREKDINTENITVDVSGNIYYRIKKVNEDEQKNEHFWKRIHFSDIHSTSITTYSKRINFSETINKANLDKIIYPKLNDDIFKANLNIIVSDYQDNLKLVTIQLVNESKDPGKPDNFDRNLYDCNISVNLEGVNIVEFENKYEYDGHAQKYYYDFRTVNCQAEWTNNNCFHTISHGRFEQENILPREYAENIDFSFKKLSGKDGIIELEKFLKLMQDRKELYRESILGQDSEEWKGREGHTQKTWGEQIDKVSHFEKVLKRYEKGVNSLKENEKSLKAFQWLNQTFNEYFTKKYGVSDGSWRVFQIIFIVSSIEAITDEENLDIADVVHVPTGGGKTEAYLGLVLFSLFYERLDGKEGGVTAIVKFPLRMLSIQQLERISSLIVFADKIRSEKSEIADKNNFSIGYFVGSSSDFPPLYKDLKDKLYDEEKRTCIPIPSVILPKCPFCSNEVLMKNDDKHKRILHVCDSCDSEYYIYLSDREIYRWRPSVIVSTVDKWAAISLQRRMRNLLGGNGSYCPKDHGFISSGDVCEKDNKEDFSCKEVGKDLPSYGGPILSIQDEMHLLREGFGSISGHFEGMIEEIVKDNSGKGMKHIALSATLSGIKKQIKEVYKKDAFVFPGNCPEGKGHDLDLFYHKVPGPNRIIYGVKPNIRDNQYASLRTLLHHIEFILEEQKLLNDYPSKFCDKYSLDNNDAQALINNYFLQLTYHIKKQDAYDMNRFESEVVNDNLENFSNTKMKGEIVTGDCSLYQLRKVIEHIDNFFDTYDISKINTKTNSIYFEPIYATSVVSHGVDLDYLNFMVFQGLPYSTAEYIQALSRVGRKNLGEIILWFYPNRVRDDSYYRNFKRYHHSLDHQVKPVPINRCARLATKQTVTSLFCGGILNYISNKKGVPLYQKKHITLLNNDDWDDLLQFMENVYGSNLDINLAEEIQSRKNQIILSDDIGDNTFFPNVLVKSGEKYYKTQTGMRGIQKSFVLELFDKNETHIKKWLGD